MHPETELLQLQLHSARDVQSKISLNYMTMMHFNAQIKNLPLLLPFLNGLELCVLQVQLHFMPIKCRFPKVQ